MSKIKDIDEEAFQAWLTDQPEIVQELAKRFRPDRLYLLKISDHRVTVASYCEDGTLEVDVTNEYNPYVLFERRVFGVKPENLVECDPLPVDPLKKIVCAPVSGEN